MPAQIIVEVGIVVWRLEESRTHNNGTNTATETVSADTMKLFHLLDSAVVKLNYATLVKAVLKSNISHCPSGLGVMRKLAAGQVDDRSVFPLKHHPGAATKVNVFLCDAIDDAIKFKLLSAEHISLFLLMLKRSGKLANDEACGWLIWYCHAC